MMLVETRISYSAVYELHHCFFQFVTVHLTMCDSNPRIWHKLVNDISDCLNIANPVVHEEDLSSSS